jgi:hypothetical protein
MRDSPVNSVPMSHSGFVKEGDYSPWIISILRVAIMRYTVENATNHFAVESVLVMACTECIFFGRLSHQQQLTPSEDTSEDEVGATRQVGAARQW